MKRLVLSFIMVGCLVGILSAQEAFDSLSYALGDYHTRLIAASNPNLQSPDDYEGYIRGLQENLYMFKQDSIRAKYYGSGLETGMYVLMMLENNPVLTSDCIYKNCIINGVRKVINGEVCLPQDTIGVDLFLTQFEDIGSSKNHHEETCELCSAFGVMLAMYPESAESYDLQFIGPDSIVNHQAYANGILEMLKNDDSYTIGKLYAYMILSTLDQMSGSGRHNYDFEVMVDAARAALGLTERKMSFEEVNRFFMNGLSYQQPIENGNNDENIADETIVAIDDVEKDESKELLRNPIVQGYSLSGRLTIKGTKGKKNPAMVWTVTLTDCDSLVLMITVTDQNGEYRFDNLPSGSYKVSFIEPLGLKRVYQVKLKNKDKAFNQTFKEDGSDYASQAQRDIFMGCPVIHVVQGDIQAVYVGEYDYKSFYEKFGVRIVDWGDIIPCDPQVFANYNKRIFDYLDETFGDEWRSTEWLQILKTVEGFNYWRP